MATMADPKQLPPPTGAPVTERNYRTPAERHRDSAIKFIGIAVLVVAVWGWLLATGVRSVSEAIVDACVGALILAVLGVVWLAKRRKART